MIAAVFDTNVLASGFVGRSSESTPAQLLDAWRERGFRLVVSQHILVELTRTFQEPYFARRLSAQQVASDIALLSAEAALVPITVEIHGVATHPEDDLTLATAVSARVDYLVTGDKKLQALGSYQGVTIISPRAFLDLLLQYHEG